MLAPRRQGGEPSRYLHVIVRGVVELRQAEERGASELVETLELTAVPIRRHQWHGKWNYTILPPAA
jgi:hypothetical protein